MEKKYHLLTVILSCTFFSNANAQFFPSDMPMILKSQCEFSENCSISHYSSSPLMEVYKLSSPLDGSNRPVDEVGTDYFSSSELQKFSANNYWLIRYEAKKGSVMNGFFGRKTPAPGFEDEEFIPYTKLDNEPVAGNIWVLAPATLGYFDNNFAIFSEINLSSTSSDSYAGIFLNMSSDVTISGNGYDFSDPYQESGGNMNVNFFTCIECGFDINFNLIGINYQADLTSEINENDERTLLVSYRDYLEGYPDDRDIETKIFVRPVPLPGAIWLFASSFIVFFRKSRLTV